MDRLESVASSPECEEPDGEVGGAKKPQRRCCTWQEIKERPEIVLWYMGNCLSYLGFYMPFVNLVRVLLFVLHQFDQSLHVLCQPGQCFTCSFSTSSVFYAMNKQNSNTGSSNISSVDRLKSIGLDGCDLT